MVWGVTPAAKASSLAVRARPSSRAARILIAGAVLLVVLAWRGVPMPKGPAVWKLFAFQALMNSVVPFTLIAWAERSIDAGAAAILNSTTPIFTFVITVALTRHEPA